VVISCVKNIDEYLELYNLSVEELLYKSHEITKRNFSNEIEFCSIISAKTGECSQNCKYCAQSYHYRTNIETYPLISLEQVKKAALNAKENGATRFSLVISGRGPEEKDFVRLLKMIEFINSIEGMSACASFGILNEYQTKSLKEAGLKRYHHNINTCKSYHDNVCTTHTYQERIETINLVKKYGMEICAGGIIGMGESRDQRIEMALELAKISPDSVPINFLYPIEGTPFKKYAHAIDEKEILKTIAVFRIILPNIILRYGGGRALKLSQKNQELGIFAGINALIVGNLLTTTGISPDEDLLLLEKTGMKLKQ
jgi:biotin synthase